MKLRFFGILLLVTLAGTTAGAETKPYWIFFKDRGTVDVAREIAAKRAAPQEPKNRSRRARLFGRDRIFDEKDIAVNQRYVNSVAEYSLEIRTVSRFLNAVSAELDERGIRAVGGLPFVRNIKPVMRFRKNPDPVRLMSRKPAVPDKLEGYSYGDSYGQLSRIGIPRLHDYGYTGTGVKIAVLDSGFDRLQHAAFDSTNIEAMWDFVDREEDVSDDNHGTKVLSVLAALDPGNMIGAAPYATYLLARTELNSIGGDQSAEEDYWVAGIEWADSLGADIVNSSLGYTTFDDGAGYTYADLDGDTAVSTIAADAAAAKGMIVVTSVGNEGNDPWNYLTVPADGDSVFAVGSVDMDGFVSGFSSHGPSFDGRIKPDFLALGENVRLVDTRSPDAYINGSGTSYSCPAVSGAVALLLEINPDWDFGTLKEALIESAESAGPDSLYGYGVIDAFAASGITPPEPSVSKFRVFDPYPQPAVFGPSLTRIYFPMQVPEEGRTVTIKIFNFSGETVKTMSSTIIGDGLLKDPGDAPSWDGTNFLGEDVAPGVYFYSIQLFGYTAHKGKLMVMR